MKIVIAPVGAALAGPASAQSLFAHAANTSGALAVEIVGWAILGFTGAACLGMLIGGIFTTLRRLGEARGPRLAGRASHQKPGTNRHRVRRA